MLLPLLLHLPLPRPQQVLVQIPRKRACAVIVMKGARVRGTEGAAIPTMRDKLREVERRQRLLLFLDVHEVQSWAQSFQVLREGLSWLLYNCHNTEVIVCTKTMSLKLVAYILFLTIMSLMTFLSVTCDASTRGSCPSSSPLWLLFRCTLFISFRSLLRSWK